MNENPSKVVVALSGGVDSSLGAALLKRAGWEVSGLHFLLPTTSSHTRKRAGRVEQVADQLGIPIDFLDLGALFSKKIILPFTEAYLTGRTPNPCVLCNQVIKFEYLLRYADEHGIERIATGHYARVTRSPSGVFELRRGTDRGKEQSYFLHRLGQRHLSRTLFPLQDLTKVEAQELALRMGLPSASDPESQEICFIPENDYRAFLEKRVGMQIGKKGDIVDRKGRKLGEHLGAYRYTIGQRHGLGIASSRPYYVVDIRAEENRIVVGRKEDLLSSGVVAEGFRWIEGGPPGGELHVLAQIRYRHRAAPGRVISLNGDRVHFEFDQPQSAVTPGQALVCYEGERVLGGGWIRKVEG